MPTEAAEAVERPERSLRSTRSVSSEQIAVLLDLLMEFRDLTLSRAALRRANEIIVAIGGADRLACECFVVDDIE